ncbi:MAG TPA: class I SAM-dependent methyltransferase [Elusimicrobiota bacterium]|nr:class I SAM-dependent methyltransferase [Elusimicrobiota bacterium]
MRCNICGAERFEWVFKNFNKPSSRHAAVPLDVLICRSCGLVCLDLTGLEPSTLAAYYTTSNTFERPTALYEGHRPMRESQVRWIAERLPSGPAGRKLLDVGCGAGYVLKLFKDRGFAVWGNDFSPAMIKNLRDTWGIPGYQGPFSPERVERSYDVITCLCVLEHTLDPADVVRQFHGTLTPGGFLALEVPDAEFPRHDMVPDHLAFDHLYHWTERTLGRLVERFGFEVVAVEHVDNPPDSGNPEPTLRLLARKTENPRRVYGEINDYDREKKVLLEYRRRHDAYLKSFQDKIDAIKTKVGDRPLAIFCGGEHTATLLSRFDFSAFNISCVYDNDPAIAGKTLGKYPIRPGSEAATSGVQHILLSTTNHERSIHDELKRANPALRVYGLYSVLD